MLVPRSAEKSDGLAIKTSPVSAVACFANKATSEHAGTLWIEHQIHVLVSDGDRPARFGVLGSPCSESLRTVTFVPDLEVDDNDLASKQIRWL